MITVVCSTSGVPLHSDPIVQRAHTAHNNPDFAGAAHTGVKTPFSEGALKNEGGIFLKWQK